MDEREWLDSFDGSTLEELLALEGTHRLDSLSVALEAAINGKRSRLGDAALTPGEQRVLSVEAFNREVNNGGLEQFLTNASGEFAHRICDDLQGIGLGDLSRHLASTFTDAGLPSTPGQGDLAPLTADGWEEPESFSDFDDAVYEFGDISEPLWAWIKANGHLFGDTFA